MRDRVKRCLAVTRLRGAQEGEREGEERRGGGIILKYVPYG